MHWLSSYALDPSSISSISLAVGSSSLSILVYLGYLSNRKNLCTLGFRPFSFAIAL